MTDRSPACRAVVVCPLEFERRALGRAGLAGFSDMACCGPGAANVTAWAARMGPVDRPVILAGLAGALDATIRAGSACWIGEVIDAQLGRWRPSLQPLARGLENSFRSITSAAQILTTPQSKTGLHAQTGAHLVDLESVAFAQAACAWRWTWGIVRGVSDEATMRLPPEIDRWVDGYGNTRPGVVLQSILARPTLLPCLISLRSRSQQAMRGVARLLDQLDPRCGDVDLQPGYKIT